jgi:hypothetical protein
MVTDAVLVVETLATADDGKGLAVAVGTTGEDWPPPPPQAESATDDKAQIHTPLRISEILRFV